MNSLPPDQPVLSTDDQRPSQQIIFLIFVGVILLLVLLGIVLYLNRPPAQIPIPTSLVLEASDTPLPSPSQTGTSTATPTLRATFTPESTRTPTPSPTTTGTPSPTLPPSLTPAVPIETNDRYSLNFWSPEQASRLINLLEAYPETLSDFTRGSDNAGYFSAFSYPLFAQREALLRFPTAPEARDWLWRSAFNLARIGDPRAGETYAGLITQELDSGRVTLEGLFDWGLERTPPVVAEVVQLDTPTGFLSSSLIRVSLEDNGSSFSWLLERPSGYSSFPLSTNFDFVDPSGANYFVEDLIGPGSVTVGTFRTRATGSLRYELPQIFNLVGESPIPLEFAPANPPEVGPDFTSDWQPVTSSSGAGDLAFVTTVFPACPVTVRHFYQWNGQAFAYSDVDYTIAPDPDLLSYCELVIEHSINVWGLEPTVQLMESLLPMWPPETRVDGGSYPADALDEWRYRLGLYAALLMDSDRALGYARSIVDNPSTPSSRWLAPAEEFLAIYQSPRDVYQACLPSIFCSLPLAFQSLVGTLAPSDNPQIIDILQDAGVTIRSQGFFDFDFDGQSERWIVLRPQPSSQLEFWILYPTETKIEALFVTPIETDAPRVTYQEPLGEPPIVQIDPDYTFQVVKQGADQQPVVVSATPMVIFSSDRTQMELDRIEEVILTGGDPVQAILDLKILGDSPFFTCSFTLCPRYYYLSGLANELNNDEKSAIAAYLEVWRRFFESPFATMARFKLAGPAIPPGPTITLTPTITRTPTITITRTPTVTGTPSTATPTGSPPVTGTVTPSLTTTNATPGGSPTVTGTITPSLTPTD